MEVLEEILKCTLWTGWIRGEKPTSLLVVADPEEGKTSILEKAKYLNGIVYLTDTTAFGIATELESRRGRNEVVNHIIIPDLLVPLAKQKTTRNTFTSFMNPLIEEGVSYIRTGAMNLKYEFQCGMIAAITREKLGMYFKEWSGTGLMSRLVPVTYEYSMSTIREILQSVVKKEYHSEKDFKLKFPKRKVVVEWDESLGNEFLPIATAVGATLKTKGIRLQKQLQVMMQAHALMNGRKKVEREDLDAIVKFSDYINFDYRKI